MSNHLCDWCKEKAGRISVVTPTGTLFFCKPRHKEAWDQAIKNTNTYIKLPSPRREEE